MTTQFCVVFKIRLCLPTSNLFNNTIATLPPGPPNRTRHEIRVMQRILEVYPYRLLVAEKRKALVISLDTFLSVGQLTIATGT